MRAATFLRGERETVVPYTGSAGEPVTGPAGTLRIMTGEYAGGIPTNPGMVDFGTLSLTATNLEHFQSEGRTWAWGRDCFVLRIACQGLPEGVSSQEVSFSAWDVGGEDTLSATITLVPGSRFLVHFSRLSHLKGFVQAIFPGIPT